MEGGGNKLYVHGNGEKLHGLEEPFHAVELYEAPDAWNCPENVIAGVHRDLWVLLNRNKYFIDPDEQDKERYQNEGYDDLSPVQDYPTVLALRYNLLSVLWTQLIDFFAVCFIQESAFFCLPIYPFKSLSDESHVLGHKGLNTSIQALTERETKHVD